MPPIPPQHTRQTTIIDPIETLLQVWFQITIKDTYFRRDVRIPPYNWQLLMPLSKAQRAYRFVSSLSSFLWESARRGD